VILLLLACGLKTDSGAQSVDGEVGLAAIWMPTGTVVVEGGAPTGASLSWSSQYDREAPTLSITAESGLLQVDTDCHLNKVCAVDLQVELPATASLQVDIIEGGLFVTGIAGDVNGAVGTGGINLDGLSGDVVVGIENGDILGSDIQSGTFAGGGVNGNREVVFSTMPTDVTLNTVAGDVHLEVPTGSYALEVATNNGTLQVEGVEEDADAPNRIGISVEDGNIEVLGR
jgi:DUF4097 and DUF4098 domain-containing protein YvlB